MLHSPDPVPSWYLVPFSSLAARQAADHFHQPALLHLLKWTVDECEILWVFFLRSLFVELKVSKHSNNQINIGAGHLHFLSGRNSHFHGRKPGSTERPLGTFQKCKEVALGYHSRRRGEGGTVKLYKVLQVTWPDGGRSETGCRQVSDPGTYLCFVLA